MVRQPQLLVTSHQAAHLRQSEATTHPFSLKRSARQLRTALPPRQLQST